jgi:drug/metabolite transporter (DMT)-like permease
VQRSVGIRKALIAMSLVGGAVTASTYLADGRFAAQGIRYVGTAVVLVAASRIRGRRDRAWRLRRPGGREWLWLIAAATCGLTLYNLALVEALQHAETPLVASIVSGVPLVLALAAPLVVRQPIAAPVVIGAATIVTGSFLVYGTGRSDAVGVALAATALACECAFTLLGAPVLQRLGAVSIATHTAWIAAVQLCVLAAASGGAAMTAGWDLPAVGAIVYLIGASAAAFVLWFDAVGVIGSALSGLAAGAIPITALATGIPLGVASTSPMTLLGVGAVVAGIVIGLRRRSADLQMGTS